MFCAGCCVSRRKDNLHVLVLVSNGSETRALLIARNSERNFPSVLFRLRIDEHIKTDSLPSLSILPTHINMPGRTRPIEKFAEATAKCSPEVRRSLSGINIIANVITGRCLWQMHCGKLPERP
jgi:hypothetical protein